MEQDVATLNAQLVEKQAVQAENDRLKLQLSSLQNQNQIEQKKADDERSDHTKIHICDEFEHKATPGNYLFIFCN